MKVVLDTSAILTGLHLQDNNEYYITPEVVNEVKDKNALIRIMSALEEGKLRKSQPRDESFNLVEEQISLLGEEGYLSPADISVLALALELREENSKTFIATDDYGIQNVAKSLSIKYTVLAERGIKKVFTWDYKCTGCGQRYDKNIILCEVCGSKIKRRIKK